MCIYRCDVTWGYVHASVLAQCDVHVDGNFTLHQADLYPSRHERGKEQQTAGVPRPKLQSDRHRVCISPTRKLQGAGGVKEGGERVWFRAGERQVKLEWEQQMKLK